MLASAVLEVGIGLVFVFLLMSLICTAIGDKISEWMEWRAAFLEKGIRELVLRGDWKSDKEFVDKTVEDLYKHPAIQSLGRETGRFTQLLQKTPVTSGALNDLAGHTGKQQWAPPSWIPSETFVLALLDVIAPESGQATKVNELRNVLENVPGLKDTKIKKTVLTLIGNGQESVQEARARVEKWFDSSMDQVTELYKQRMYVVALVIGVVVSVVLNVDTIAVANYLWRDPSVRASVVAAAVRYASQPPSSPVPISSVREELEKLDLPMAWARCSDCRLSIYGFVPQEWASTAPLSFESSDNYSGVALLKIVGWIITGFAAAQGAPFWFDVLKKLTRESKA